jgi:hypothetical protein
MLMFRDTFVGFDRQCNKTRGVESFRVFGFCALRLGCLAQQESERGCRPREVYCQQGQHHHLHCLHHLLSTHHRRSRRLEEQHGGARIARVKTDPRALGSHVARKVA